MKIEKMADEEKCDGMFAMARAPRWQDRLRWRLFPMDYAGEPDAKHGVAVEVTVCVDWKDRLRLLFSGRCCVQTRLGAKVDLKEMMTGQSVSAFSVLPPEFLKARAE